MLRVIQNAFLHPQNYVNSSFFSGSGLVLTRETNKVNITLGVREARYLGVNHFFHVSTMWMAEMKRTSSTETTTLFESTLFLTKIYTDIGLFLCEIFVALEKTWMHPCRSDLRWVCGRKIILKLNIGQNNYFV